MIERGREALAQGRLTESAEDNALAYAEQALDLSPEDRRAKHLMSDAIARVVERGESALAQGSIPEAKAHGDQAESLSSEHELSAALESVLSKHIEAQEKRLAEEQREKIAREELEQRKTELIEKARNSITAGRLISPSEHNALTYARELLRLAPGEG